MEGQAGRISHYRVLGELGRDRLGYVLRAADEQLDRPVVLRVVRAASVVPPERVAVLRAAFQRAAKRAARISHPNLVTIYAFEAIGDVDLIAMEEVEGASLRAMLALGDRWRVPEAARMAALIADAVAAAHGAKMAHGRLSLANVIVRSDGRIKVLDLGIPRLPDDVPAGAGHDGQEAEWALTRPPDLRSDVRALGAITWELAASAARPPGALWRPLNLEADELAAALEDGAAARIRFGILGPVLARSLAPSRGEGYRDATEFRDAVAGALAEPARPAAEAFEAGPLGTVAPLIEPPPSTAPAGALLESGAGLGISEAASRGPRLVLPADLAHGMPPSERSYVVMSQGGMGERLRTLGERLGDGLGRRAEVRRPGAWIAAVIVLVLVLGGVIAAQRMLSSEDASAAILARDDGGHTTPPASEDEPAVAAMAADTTISEAPAPLAADSPAPVAQENDDGMIRTAVVRAGPEGTRITLREDPDRAWLNYAELSVADGDSIMLRFTRPGYVPQTLAFRGSRISVQLEPDSVVAQFESNVPAEVYLVAPNGGRRLLGTTALSARLPSGSHRILFRAPDQPDWTTTQNMSRPGQTYAVRKTDYVTEGTLVVTVSNTWAWVSVDGGAPQETPLRIEGLAAGLHRIRLTRDGFVTVDDTVTVRPRQTVTRPYTLRPAG